MGAGIWRRPITGSAEAVRLSVLAQATIQIIERYYLAIALLLVAPFVSQKIGAVMARVRAADLDEVLVVLRQHRLRQLPPPQRRLSKQPRQ